jgi:fibronectin type 3 domain-containing protein
MKKHIVSQRNNIYVALAIVVFFAVFWYVLQPPKIPSSIDAGVFAPAKVSKKMELDRKKESQALGLFFNQDYLSIEESIVSKPSTIIDNQRKILIEERVAAPSNVLVTDIKNGKAVTVSWDSFIKPPAFIRIFRAESASEKTVKIGEVKGDEVGFHDTSITVGKTYYYTVSSALEDGMESDLAGPFSVGPIQDAVPPDPPSLIVITLEEDGVHIVWEDPSDDDLALIKIYRSEIRGLEGEEIAEIESGVQKFVDSVVTVGKTYYYFLKSQDIHGNESSNEFIDAKLGNPNIFTPAF